MAARYDEIADEYAAGIAAGLSPNSVPGIATQALLDLAGEVAGLEVCDLGCGEGHLARLLAERGAVVTGVDLSERLLALAREKTASPRVRYLHEDAQVLASLPPGAYDLVVSNLALMDIPDLQATYRAVHRVLRSEGRFVFSLTHPCFQAPGTSVETDTEGRFAARRIPRYLEEGFWRSEGVNTIRSRVGAYHRTLSTYLNGLLDAGFTLRRLTEPAAPPGTGETPYEQAHAQIPSVLVIDCRRS